MKCKACGQETDKETTKIILTFSISTPELVDIHVENNYESLSMAMVMNNKKQLHELLDKTLDTIEAKLFEEKTK